MAYNRDVKLTGILLTVALLAFGCSGSGGSDDAVKQGVMEHLSSRAGLDVSSMDVEVSSVTFQDGEAEATVSFRPKGVTDPEAGMQMQYKLEKKGSRWVVKGKAGASGSAPHGGGMESPHGGMPPSGEMPSGHPPVQDPKQPGSTE